MNQMKAILIFCLCFLRFNFGKHLEKPWQALKVTFPRYENMPLTVNDARSSDFIQIGSESICAGAFKGYRYMKNNDPSVILLFGTNGYIAGVQSCFLESEVHKLSFENELWFRQYEAFTMEYLPDSDRKCFTLTAYFINPDIICTTGRTKNGFQLNPLGNNLYIKIGTKNILIPNHSSGLADTEWTLEKCFLAMGTHYYYNVTKDMECSSLFPFFLMYDEDNLLKVFGFIVHGPFYSSENYENSKSPIAKILMYSVPECILDSVITSIHFATVANTNNLMCPGIFNIG